jgi:hypothetical protein
MRADGGDHFVGLWKHAPLLFADLDVVAPHGVLAGVADDELAVDAELLLQLSCRPGSARAIPSGVTVANDDLHPAYVTPRTW